MAGGNNEVDMPTWYANLRLIRQSERQRLVVESF